MQKKYLINVFLLCGVQSIINFRTSCRCGSLVIWLNVVSPAVNYFFPNEKLIFVTVHLGRSLSVSG